MKYIKGIDTLRAFAIICVIITHWGPKTINSSKFLTFFLQRILPTGSFAVNLFFVLSGFLITTILLISKEQASGKSQWSIIKNFYIRRSLRIFPIYYIFLLLNIALGIVKSNYLYYFTYTSNFLVFNKKSWTDFSHTWSLAVEEQFYLLWPWIVIYIPTKYLTKICLAFILIEAVCSIWYSNAHNAYFHVLPMNCFGAFALGALYSYFRVNEKGLLIFKKIILILLPISIFIYFRYGSEAALIRLNDSLISIALIMFIVERKRISLIKYLFENPVLTNLGKISYGIYLYHYTLPIIYIKLLFYIDSAFHTGFSQRGFFVQATDAYVIKFILLLLISYLSYYTIERAFLNFKKYFDYNIPVRHATVKENS